MKYFITSDGQIRVDAELHPAGGFPELLRFGMQTRVPAMLDSWTLLGKGPHENYIDREKGAAMGLYSISVRNDYFHYAWTQQSNNRIGVRWRRR